ncbi:hypothetical protein EVAR_76589_1 [Eumeta japonica]|uniref:Uncharacterized protein n=1 Tax=Eumeta variegata TaxID=151549 RepID=A0A4C1T832_EUMVA|nr:hypothetical protein EVAR_76589_1 [Eumeta japonica]
MISKHKLARAPPYRLHRSSDHLRLEWRVDLKQADKGRNTTVFWVATAVPEFSPILANPGSRAIFRILPIFILARVQYTIVHLGVTGITTMTSISKRLPPFSIIYRHPQTDPPPLI